MLLSENASDPKPPNKNKKKTSKLCPIAYLGNENSHMKFN